MRYRQKAVEVKAIQWNGKNDYEIQNIFGKIVGLEHLTIGAFVVKHADGKIEALTEKQFYNTYDMILGG